MLPVVGTYSDLPRLYMEGNQMRVNTNTGGWVMMAGALLAAILLPAGCEGPPERLNAPPQGQSDRPAELQDTYARMADNALLNERSMSPAHFVPGSTELNSLGARRLKRYATLLKVYGGELTYDGVEDSEEMAEHRVGQIKQYLVACGLGPDNFTVAVGPAGGRGFRAGEAEETRKGLTPPAEKVAAAQERIIVESQH